MAKEPCPPPPAGAARNPTERRRSRVPKKYMQLHTCSQDNKLTTHTFSRESKHRRELIAVRQGVAMLCLHPGYGQAGKVAWGRHTAHTHKYRSHLAQVPWTFAAFFSPPAFPAPVGTR